MIDPYVTLGVTHFDDLEQVKKQYRKMANKHHPDKTGGNTKKFQEIKESYEMIINHLKTKAEPNKSNEKVFSSVHDFTNFFQQRKTSRTQFITIETEISLNKAINGGIYSLNVSYQGMSSPYRVSIMIPQSVFDNELIRYPGILGDGTIDLHVRFHITPSKDWERNGLNLTRHERFNFWELILGTSRDISTITGGKVRLSIPPMTEPGTKFKIPSLGAMDRQNPAIRGTMFVHVEAALPKSIPQEIKNLIAFEE